MENVETEHAKRQLKERNRIDSTLLITQTSLLIDYLSTFPSVKHPHIN